MVTRDLIRADKYFELGGTRVEFEGRAGLDAWCVLVGGRRVPMTFAEVECIVTNANSYDKPLRPPARVDWAPIGRALASPAAFEVGRSAEGIRARCDIGRSQVAMFNTVIHESEWISIVLPPDLSMAAVTLHHYTDTSS